jgi:hypothetical protein
MDEMDKLRLQHSLRFHRVANAYPRIVAFAYGLDIAAAAKDDDATVAARVREWEIAQGIEPRDWIATGLEQGREEHPEDEALIAQAYGRTRPH